MKKKEKKRKSTAMRDAQSAVARSCFNISWLGIGYGFILVTRPSLDGVVLRSDLLLLSREYLYGVDAVTVLRIGIEINWANVLDNRRLCCAIGRVFCFLGCVEGFNRRRAEGKAYGVWRT